jgi:DNA ligase 1
LGVQSFPRRGQNALVLFADVVTTSAQGEATRSRKAKIDALAELLRQAGPGDAPLIVGYLVGEPRQGRVGVGWATVRDLEWGAASEPSLTVDDIDRTIDNIVATTGSGSVGARRDLLSALFARATKDEGDFIARLFTGEVRHGALAGVMLDAIARAADVPADAVRRACMLGGSLGDTAERALVGGLDALTAVSLQVLRPVLPMLAATSPGVADAIEATGLASVEWKLDGARIQVHRQNDDVRIFTRNLNDITERLPEVVRLVREFPAAAFVLDGETIGVDEEARPHAFQDTMSRFGRDDSNSHTMVMSSFFFDVLHVDGRDVIDEPLRERSKLLDAIVGDRRVPFIQTADADEAAAFLAHALDTGHEGVMVKGIESRYEAGRRGSAWRKVKPVRTFDLVVLGAEWGHGRRRGWLSNLHLGARDPETGAFVMVGKTFKGLTDELLTWQTERLQEIKVSDDGHVVMVRPELVIEIALDGVQASTRYTGGVALRFARVRGYRPDKNPEDADTIDAVRALLH